MITPDVTQLITCSRRLCSTERIDHERNRLVLANGDTRLLASVQPTPDGVIVEYVIGSS